MVISVSAAVPAPQQLLIHNKLYSTLGPGLNVKKKFMLNSAGHEIFRAHKSLAFQHL